MDGITNKNHIDQLVMPSTLVHAKISEDQSLELEGPWHIWNGTGGSGGGWATMVGRSMPVETSCKLRRVTVDPVCNMRPSWQFDAVCTCLHDVPMATPNCTNGSVKCGDGEIGEDGEGAPPALRPLLDLPRTPRPAKGFGVHVLENVGHVEVCCFSGTSYRMEPEKHKKNQPIARVSN